MKHLREEYLELLRAYLSGSMTAENFQRTYLDKFKIEDRSMGEELFNVLDRLFGDVDVFCQDPLLLAELSKTKPGWYLDEKTLRGRVEEAVKGMEGIATESD